MKTERWFIVGLLGASAAAIVVADLVNPGYDWVAVPVSRYVNGTAGRLTTVAILGIGVASAAVVARVRGPGRWVLAVWAAGVLVAGVFPADPHGQWATPSASDMVHGSAALLAFAAFPVAALLLSRGRRGLRAVAWLSVPATAAFAVYFVDVTDGPDIGFGGLGLAERVLIAVNLVWLVMAAGRRAAHSDPGRAARRTITC